jgi:hypothetical protein
MLWGLHNQWKKPVAYYLIHGNIKGEILVNFLMEVLDAHHNAGLEVVAPCTTWVPKVSKPGDCWVFPRRHFSSAFRIKKLQLI